MLDSSSVCANLRRGSKMPMKLRIQSRWKWPTVFPPKHHYTMRMVWTCRTTLPIMRSALSWILRRLSRAFYPIWYGSKMSDNPYSSSCADYD